jgi:hypothetical protein
MRWGLVEMRGASRARRGRRKPAIPYKQRLLLWVLVAFAVAVLLLRMAVFVRGRR